MNMRMALLIATTIANIVGGLRVPCVAIEKIGLTDWQQTWKIPKWNVVSDPCLDAWTGVTCDDSGHVVALDLRGGIVADSLNGMPNLRMPHLRKLDISNCHLTGELPENLFDTLPSIRMLDLSNNRFTGGFPNSMNSLTELEVGKSIDR